MKQKIWDILTVGLILGIVLFSFYALYDMARSGCTHDVVYRIFHCPK